MGKRRSWLKQRWAKDTRFSWAHMPVSPKALQRNCSLFSLMAKFPQTCHLFFLNSHHPSAHCLSSHPSTPLNQPCWVPGHLPRQIQGTLFTHVSAAFSLSSNPLGQGLLHHCPPSVLLPQTVFYRKWDWALSSGAVLERPRLLRAYSTPGTVLSGSCIPTYLTLAITLR